MEQNEDSSGAPPPSAARTNVVEAAVAVLTLAVGIVVMVASRRLGAGWTSDGPGSGYFPFYIGLIVAVSSTAILVQALVGKHRNTGSFVDTQQLKRVMSVLLPAVAYVLLVRFLGLYVASTIYIALPVTEWFDKALFSKMGKKGSSGGKSGGKARELRAKTEPVPAD